MTDHKKCLMEVRMLRKLLKQASDALKSSYGFVLADAEAGNSYAKPTVLKSKKAITELNKAGF